MSPSLRPDKRPPEAREMMPSPRQNAGHPRKITRRILPTFCVDGMSVMMKTPKTKTKPAMKLMSSARFWAMLWSRKSGETRYDPAIEETP